MPHHVGWVQEHQPISESSILKSYIHTKDIFLVKDVIFHQTYAAILIQDPK